MPYYNSHQKKQRKNELDELLGRILSQYNLVTDMNDQSYEYNGLYWQPMKEKRLQEYCAQCCHNFYGYLPNNFKDIYYLVKSKSRDRLSKLLKLQGQVGVPWNNIKETEVPFKNGVYDAKLRKLRAHRDDDFLETVWPVEYVPKSKCPTWNRYLKSCFGHLDDYKDYVAVIEEFLGYIMIQKAPYKKALFCFGESNTGKTVLQDVMVALVGQQNICHIPIDKMNSPRALAPIKGKAVNIMSELKFDTILADSGFKRLVSTGEPVQIDQKYKDPISYEPFCKHAVFTNAKPNIHDHTDAVYNRLILLEFSNIIPTEKQDPYLPQKLEKEIEGIALRALKGLKRLIKNKGKFTIPDSVRKAVDDYKEEMNPVDRFLKDCCKEKLAGFIFLPDVRKVFRDYCPRAKGWSNKRITQYFKTAGCEIKETSRKGKKGQFVFGYVLERRYFEEGMIQYMGPMDNPVHFKSDDNNDF